MARVRAPWPTMGVLIGDGTEGERGDAARSHGWGPGGGGVLEALGVVGGARPARVLLCSEEEELEEREEKEKREKEKGRKKGKLLNLKI
jgi:hypothetical protein